MEKINELSVGSCFDIVRTTVAFSLDCHIPFNLSFLNSYIVVFKGNGFLIFMPFSGREMSNQSNQCYYVNDKVNLLYNIDVYVRVRSCSRTHLLLGYKGRIDEVLNKAMRGVYHA